MRDTRFVEMQDEVQAFHKAHPAVWELFVRFTLERIKAGFLHYSVNAIFERIRWESDVATDEGGSTFKLNNNYRAFYARRFMRMYPEWSGFFRTREQPSKQHRSSGMPPLGPDHYPTYPQGARQIAP